MTEDRKEVELETYGDRKEGRSHNIEPTQAIPGTTESATRFKFIAAESSITRPWTDAPSTTAIQTRKTQDRHLRTLARAGGNGSGTEDGSVGGEKETPSRPSTSVTSKTSNSACCAAFCWFACACSCHNSTKALLMEAGANSGCSPPACTFHSGLGVARGGSTRAVGSVHQPRRRRERPAKAIGNDTNHSGSPKRTSKRQALNMSVSMTPQRDVESRALDVERAFLASSESRGGARTIHFGTAARFFSSGSIDNSLSKKGRLGVDDGVQTTDFNVR